jgi:hypothetical protein
MNFALALVHDNTLEVSAVMRADAPFDDGHTLFATDHHMVHVGAFAHEEPPAGVAWTEWLRTTLSVAADGSVKIASGGPKRLDAACTLDGIAAAARGGRKVHAHVEAWLRTTLSSHLCDALGLRRSIPISVVKALDDVRVNRLKAVVPAGSWSQRGIESRREVLERIAQRRIDARLEAHYRAHQAKGKQ